MNNRSQVLINTLFFIFCAVIFSTRSFAEPANIAVVHQEILAYHDSGRYQRELDKVIKKADEYLLQRADSNLKSNHPQQLALVLDIDETSLSSYSKMAARNFHGTPQIFHDEVLAADFPAIESTLALYNDALKHHIAVFFVTGRPESAKRATIKNLENAGFHDWAGLYMKPENYKAPSIIPYKAAQRADVTQKGYFIIASIGDQKSDLRGGYADKTFKLPNPYYFIQ